MVLKKAYGPAFLAGLSIAPTLVFGQRTKERFLRCYQDAGLVQTSQLDGWDITKPTSWNDREEFRKWLVDCHKAAYIPICLAGVDNFLTAEPAVVLSNEGDNSMEATMEMKMEHRRPRAASQESLVAHRPRTSTMDSAIASIQSSQSNQRNALFRRVPRSASFMANSGSSQIFSPHGR